MFNTQTLFHFQKNQDLLLLIMLKNYSRLHFIRTRRFRVIRTGCYAPKKRMSEKLESKKNLFCAIYSY